MAITRVGGTDVTGTGAVTQTYPTGYAEDDLALLFCESMDQAVSAPTGYTELSSSPQAATGTRLTAFYRVLDGTDSSTFSVSDSGDHTATTLQLWRGVDTTSPINATTGNVGGATTSITATGVTTSADDCAIIIAVGTSRDAAFTNVQFSAWTNANISSLTEVADRTMSGASGGGYGVAWGIKSAAGSTGDTTVTQATADYWDAITIALKPAAGGSASQTNTASGSITFNGDASTAIGITATTFGFLTFNDGAGIQVGRAFLTDGFLAFDGAASEEHSGTQSQTNNAAGSLSLSGDAALSSGLVLTTAGSLAFTQGANISYGVINVPTGSLLFSGAAGMSSGGPSIPGSDFNWRSRGYGR